MTENALKRPSSDAVANATRLQHQAADPDSHIWVMASAGTGKTTVLVDRFIRLVLKGTSPEKILCLTYTKAAATQMKERILRRLSQWVCLDETTLREDIERMSGMVAHADDLQKACNLFGDLLDSIDTLSIMTIHAFCQSLLNRFQVEAGLPGGAEIMDDAHAQEMLSGILHDILMHDTGDYIERLAYITHDGGWQDLIAKIVMHRSDFHALFASGVNARESIQTILGIEEGDTPQSIKARLINSNRIPWTVLSDAFPKAVEDLTQLRGLIALDLNHAFDLYSALFLTQKGEARKLKFKDDVIAAAMFQEMQLVLAAQDSLRALATANASHDLCALAQAALQRYQTTKSTRGLLDYDDLIEKTRELLSDKDAAAWVRFKLDGGIDHVLVDEAQDTSPLQWQIVAEIVQEYFAGLGRKDPENRTLFVVGDEKQSIFSFQGAEPETTEAFHITFGRLAHESKRPLQDVPLTTSFRTAQDILDVVDAVFAPWQTQHDAGKPHPGRVEIWPVIDIEKAEKTEAPWSLPEEKQTNARDAVIEQAVDAIANLLDQHIALPSQNGAPIKPGDILILVKTRTHYPRALIRALRNRNIPVAGLDRLGLIEDIAVQDMLAALRWAMFPDDDLSLAAFLKSPFIGFDDARLGAVAIGRTGSLWGALRQAEPESAPYLADLARRFRRDPAGRTFRHMISRPCPNDNVSGRRALQSRLGPACMDALDELLAYADAQERETPGALSFLHHIERSAPVLKREMEGGSAGGVRIMTAHGAKGLEAPIVFLIDTLHTDASMAKADELQWADGPDNIRIPLWAPREDDRADLVADMRETDKDQQRAEYQRLLYVAMTRAQDALIVMGATSGKKASDESWYHAIDRAIGTLPARMDGDKRVYGGWAPQSASMPLNTTPVPHEAILPMDEMEWVDEEEEEIAAPDVTGNERAKSIGRQWHKLMERAMERSEAEIEDMLVDWLDDLPDLKAEPARDRLKALREHQVYGALFRPGGAVEVPFIASGETYTRGRIDRLVKTEDTLWIIDYKSRFDPNDPPQRISYTNQLEGYKRALAPLAGNTPIRTLLVDIGAGTVLELDL